MEIAGGYSGAWQALAAGSSFCWVAVAAVQDCSGVRRPAIGILATADGSLPERSASRLPWPGHMCVLCWAACRLAAADLYDMQQECVKVSFE